MTGWRDLRGGQWIPGPLIAAVATVALAVGWLSTGSSAPTVLWWLATLALGVLLPGWVVLALVRPSGALTRAGWFAPVGLVWTLLVWLVGHLVGTALPSLVAGPALLAVVLAVPAGRRRLTARAPAGATDPPGGAESRVRDGLGYAAGLAVAVLVVARWMWSVGLARWAPVPSADRPVPYQDLLYQTALTGELRRNLVPGYPMVDGEPLAYHWFFHATAAQLGGSGLADLDVVTRLLPSSLVVVLVVLAGTVGHQVTGRLAGGVGAALALALLRGPTLDSWTPAPLSVVVGYWEASPTATLGWVFGLATVGCAIALLRRRPEDRAAPVVLLPAFALAAAGSKSAQLPVIIAGLGVAALVGLLGWRSRPDHRRLSSRYGLVLLVVVIAQVLALVFIYPGSYGLRFSPFEWVNPAVRSLLGSVDYPAATTVEGGLISFTRMWLPPVLATAGLATLVRRSPRDPSGWLGLGIVAASVGAQLVLIHPSHSELYFAIAGFPIAVALSGAAVGAEIGRLAARSDGTRRRVSPRAAGALGVGLLCLGSAVGLVLALAHEAGEPSPRTAAAPTGSVGPALASQVLADWARPVVVLTAALVLLAGLGAVLIALVIGGEGDQRRSRRRMAWTVAPALLAAVALAAGVVGLSPLLASTTATPASFAEDLAADAALGRPAVTRSLYEAGQYLRTHAAPTDVIATNRVFNGHGPGGLRDLDDNRDFSVSALSGLRTDVSGYGYAPRVVAEVSPIGGYFRPFWDPARLAREQALITDPTRSGLDRAYRDGVRWILADERSGPVSERVSTLAQSVVDSDGVHLYRIPAPADG
ncbi:MAG: hypothetical protein ABIS35_13390 [Terracoccus sp.]